MKKILALITCAILLTSCSNGEKLNAVIKPSERKPAPELSGLTLNGSNFSTDLKKITVINVWASWCAPCRAEAPILSEFALKNPQIQFVGIVTRDNLSAAEAFVKRFNLNYPTFVDDSLINKFQGSIPANGIPTTLIIDKNGLVAARISGATTVANLKHILESVSGGSVNA